MSLRFGPRAVLCQLLSAPVIAIALGGCGGIAATTQPDASPAPDASPTPDASPAPGCPSAADIQDGAALGRTCSPEGAYCPDPTCDPCVDNCAAVSCSQGTWSKAINTAVCSVDAGAPCPSIDGSGFDQSCQSDSDCVAVTAGTFCPGAAQCPCGRDAVNVKDQSKYEQLLSAIEAANPPGPGGCNCPFFGVPRCIAGRCTICGGASPTQCPDGG